MPSPRAIVALLRSAGYQRQAVAGGGRPAAVLQIADLVPERGTGRFEPVVEPACRCRAGGWRWSAWHPATCRRSTAW